MSGLRVSAFDTGSRIHKQKGRNEMTKLFDLLGKQTLFFDGAMGTMLQQLSLIHI